MPAARRGRDNIPPILLPCCDSKASIYNKYKESCEEADKRHVGSTVFYEVWNSCVPHIEFMKPKTDLCKTCFELRENIAGEVTHYRFEIRQNSVKSTVRSEIDHFRCKIGSGW